jgi:Uncharacterized conserved protein
MNLRFSSIQNVRSIAKMRLLYVRDNSKVILQFLIAALFLGVGFWFFKHEGSELLNVKQILVQSRLLWVCLGIVMTFIYVILQGYAYKLSFAMVRRKVSLWLNIIMFLKRNFVSVFLPAGGVTSLAFFSGEIEKRGVSKSSINFASSVYAFLGILSVIVIALPIFTYSLAKGLTGSSEIIALGLLIVMLGGIFLCYKSIVRKGSVYKVLVKYIPSSEVFLGDIISHQVDRLLFGYAFFVSVLVDVAGIIHLYIAMLALGFSPTIESAMLSYMVSVVFLIVSPFMRGLGAIEVSMTFILTRFGYSSIEAIAITLLYRFFEFWLPLVLGIFSFLIKINKLLMRVIPALLILVLGIINILSVMTASIAERVKFLHDFIPLTVIRASNHLVLLAGFLMLLTSIFLIRGLRTAWWMAFLLSVVSIVGHLTKAIDYEEAIIALLVMVMLIFSKKEYVVRTNPRLRNVGVLTALFSVVAVLIYGVVGFYFLDKHHFNIDFSIGQSIRYTLQYYFMLGSDLVPSDHFTRHFLASISICGLITLSFLCFTIVYPYIFKYFGEPSHIEIAQKLISRYGKSSVDYFKTYNDKLFFFSKDGEAFIAYRVVASFAVVLEDPVAADQAQMKACIEQFDRYCFSNGLKCIYYRVPQSSLSIYAKMKKKSLFIGQEAVVDLESFTLEGRKRGTLRNAVNKVADKDFKTTVHTPPLKDGLLQKLKAVSDEWLIDSGRSEIVFSQGMFIWEELKGQTVMTVESPEEKIAAFLNIIPDYAHGEITYDLIRKTTDAPNGVTMFLLIEFFKYAKGAGFKAVNLGFAPMSGIEVPKNATERSMRYAYNSIRTFSHYKGLREFKERFYPNWHNIYLIYDHDFDLLAIPTVLTKVIKP